MSKTALYNGKEVHVIVGGNLITGFATGSIAKVARNEDAFTFQANADGGGTRSKSNNRSGTITITLAQTSPSNDVLSTLALLDETANQGAVPVLVKDSLGRSVFSAQQAWVRKLPDSDFGVESGEREWALECGDLEYFVGGNG